MTGPSATVAEAGPKARAVGKASHDGLAAAARRLVSEVAPALGLRPDEVRLHIGDHGRRAAAFGARGLVDRGQVFLAADAETRPGRAVLVHELAHLAQQRLPGPAPARGAATPAGRAAPARGAATPADGGRPPLRPVGDPEAEARALAEAFLGGGRLWRPAVALHPGAVAADTGTTTLPRPAPRTTAPPAEPEHETAADIEVSTGQLEAELGRLAQARYADLRSVVIRHLSGLWVDGGDVSDCLQALDTIPFLHAQALSRSLPADKLTDLGKNLDDGHHQQFPATTVAALSAMSPMSLRWLEVRNVQGLDTRAFGPVELRAALRALRGLRRGILVELFQGDRGEVFTALVQGNTPGGDDRDALRAALAQLTPHTIDEARAARTAADARTNDVLRRIRPTLRSPSEGQALDALRDLASLAEAPPAPTPVPAPERHGSEPRAPAEYQAPPPPEPGRQLRLAVAALESEGLIRRLLDALPGSARRADSDQASRLLVVLAAREPFRTLTMIESLLSYGLFDWAITDAEARFAYLLVRSLSVDQQERWRRLDEGKWFRRLEENIPREDVLNGAYRGVGRGAGDVRPLSRTEARSDPVLRLVRDIDTAVQGGIDASKAIVLLRRLLSVGRLAQTAEHVSPREGGPGDPEGTLIAEASLAVGAGVRRILADAVARLDTLGDMDPILDALPDAYLLNEMWRNEVVEILAVRDPRHLERHARRLLSRGLFDWAVTAHEAWLAFQIVRNLSPEDQERLQREDPDRYARIQSEMTDAMRASASVTAISGRAALATRDRLRRRLADRAIWSGARAVELRSLIIQLYALDDGRWVFLRSRDVQAHTIAGLEAVVSDLKLYHPPDREDFDPERLRAPSAIGETLSLIGRALAVTPYGVGLFLRALSSMFSTEVQLTGVDLERVQALLGGDISGIRLRPRPPRPAAPAGRAGDRARDRLEATEPNRFSVWIIPSEHKLGLEVPQLDLASLLQTGPGWSLRTGRGTLRGLSVIVDYSDRHFTTPSAAVLDVGRIDITDIVLAKAEALIAATRFGLDLFRVRAGQRDPTELTRGAPPGTLPIPVIGPIVNFVRNYFDLFGTLPGLSSAVGALSAPFTGGAPWLAQQAFSESFSLTLTPLAESVLGLVADGAFKPPRTVKERTADAIAMLRSASISFTDLEVDGLSFGGTQQVASVHLRDVVLGIGTTRTTVIRARIASAERLLGSPTLPDAQRSALQQHKQTLEATLAELTRAEHDLDALEGRYRVNERSLNDDERATMLRLSRLLRRTAGGAVDIGGISIGPLSGQVEAAGIEVGAIHAEADVPSLVGEYLPPQQLARRFQEEGAGPTPGQVARRGHAEATIASLRLVTRPGEPALRVLGSLPDPVDVEREQRGLVGDDPATVRRREELRPWAQKLRRLRYLESLDPEPLLPDGELNPYRASEADLAERETLRREAQVFFGLSADTITATGITARLDPATAGIDINAAQFDVTGIRAGATRVAAIHGEDVGAGVALDTARGGGRLAPAQSRRLRELGLPDRSVVGRVHAGKLTLTGIERPGMTAASITANGLRGSIVPVGDDYSLPDLHLDSVDLDSVEYVAPARRIFAGGATHLGPIDAVVDIATAPDRTPGAAADARKVSRVVIRSLRIGRIEGQNLGIEGRQPAPGYEARITGGALVGVQVTDLPIDLGDQQTNYTGHISVAQLEQLRFAVVSKAFRGPPSSTLTGTLDSPPPGAGNQAGALEVDLLSSGDTDIRAQDVALTDGTLTTSSGTIRVRRLGLAAAHVVQEHGGRIVFDGITIASLDVSSIDWRAAGGHITASGSTVLENITAAGNWSSEADREAAGGRVVPGRKVLNLDHLHVGRIRSDDLHYRSGDIDLHLGTSPAGPGPGPGTGGTGTAGPTTPRRPDLLDVRDVDVTGLRWSTGGTLGEQSVTTGQIDVGRTSVEIGGAISRQLGLRARLQAGAIHATLLGTGGTRLRATGLEGDVGITDASGALLHHASFVGADTGAVVIHDNVIDIGPEGSDGLSIPSLVIDALDWHGSGIGVQIPPTSGAGIAVAGIHARAQIVLRRPGETGPMLRRLLLRELVVDEIRATGVKISMTDATITLDPDQETVVAGLRLLPAEGQQGFVVEPTQTGQMAATGRLELGALQLPWVAADIGTFLHANADVSSPGMTVDFFGAAGLDVDIRQPRLDNISAQIGSDPGHRLFMINPTGDGRTWGIRASSLHYQSRTGTGPGGRDESRVEVRGTEFNGLLYANRAQGVTVFVRHGVAPGTITHHIESGQGSIPDLIIDDAFFQVDMPTLLGPSSPSRARPISDILLDIRTAIAPNAAALSTLNGHIWATLETGYYDVPLDLRFRNGEVDLDRAVSEAQHGVPALSASTENGNTLVLSANVPIPTPIPPYVTIKKVGILSWTLSSGQIARYESSGRVDWQALLAPTGSSWILSKQVGGSTGPSDIRVSNIHADLNMHSTGRIPVDLGAHGRLVLAPDAVAHLIVAGNVGGATAAGGRSGLIVASLERVSVEQARLLFGSTEVNTGSIDVTDVTDLRMTFSDFSPRLLSGHITRARAQAIRWGRSGP